MGNSVILAGKQELNYPFLPACLHIAPILREIWAFTKCLQRNEWATPVPLGDDHLVVARNRNILRRNNFRPLPTWSRANDQVAPQGGG